MDDLNLIVRRIYPSELNFILAKRRLIVKKVDIIPAWCITNDQFFQDFSLQISESVIINHSNNKLNKSLTD